MAARGGFGFMASEKHRAVLVARRQLWYMTARVLSWRITLLEGILCSTAAGSLRRPPKPVFQISRMSRVLNRILWLGSVP